MAEAQAEDEDETPDEDTPEETQDEAAPEETQQEPEAAPDEEPAEEEPSEEEPAEGEGSGEADEEEAPEDEGPSEEERQLERLKTEAIQQVVPVGFPLTKDAALEQAGHRRVQVGDTTLTVNMILSQLRGDDWRTGLDFQDAIERAWDDIQEAYL